MSSGIRFTAMLWATMLGTVALGSLTAHADPYVEMDVRVKVGKHVAASPHLSVEAGKLASLTQLDVHGEGIEVEVKPTVVDKNDPKATDSILMEIAVYILKPGSRQLVAQPRILSLVGKKASLSEKSGPNSFQFSVTPILGEAPFAR